LEYSVGGIEFDYVREETVFPSEQVITAAMFPRPPSDVRAKRGIVLGSGIASLPVLRSSMDLLERGLVEGITICGGAVINSLPETPLFAKALAPTLKRIGFSMPRNGETEADYMVRYLKTTRGAGAYDYEVENTSTNTGETFRKLAAMETFQRAKSVNIVGLLPTRALMTLRQVEEDLHLSPKIVAMTNVIPLEGVTRDNWMNSDISRFFVLSEFLKIDPSSKGNYFGQGLCKNVYLEGELNLADGLPHWPTKLVESAPLYTAEA